MKNSQFGQVKMVNLSALVASESEVNKIDI